MGCTQDFFSCNDCDNKDFKRVYNFSLLFHKVNFSDDLIYDQIVDEIYQCTKCKKTFTKNQIEDALAAIKKKRKMNV